MPRGVVALQDMQRRMPEAGRIRLGEKVTRNGKSSMTSIDTFRFTSPFPDLINLLAEMYGGTAQTWNDPKASPTNQFQVKTTTAEIDVLLPPDALSVWYELWAGGGVQRRCDGETVEVPVVTAPGQWEMQPTPCICAAANKMECRPYSRLNVMIPGIPFRGMWRLETKGWNAAAELPGMIDAIEMLAAQGKVVRAKLGVQRRARQTIAGKRNFVVPTVTLAESLEQALAGGAHVQALAGPQVAALPAAPEWPTARQVEGVLGLNQPIDDGIAEAIVVGGPFEQLADRVWQCAAERHLDGERLWAGIRKQVAVSDGKPVPEDDQVKRIENCIALMDEGKLDPIGFQPDGTVNWQRR